MATEKKAMRNKFSPFRGQQFCNFSDGNDIPDGMIIQTNRDKNNVIVDGCAEMAGGSEEEIVGGCEEEIDGGCEEEIVGGCEEEIDGGCEEEIDGGCEKEIVVSCEEEIVGVCEEEITSVCEKEVAAGGDWFDTKTEVNFLHGSLIDIDDFDPSVSENIRDYQLHRVCHRGDVQALQVLLTSGLVNVNEGNYDLNRPLHEACLAGHYDCVVLLCSYGADVNLRNIDGATALCDACSKGSLECIELLLRKGAMVNLPFLLITPLHETVLGNNWHCITTLLKHGAFLEASDLDYGTPLQTAVSKGYIECARILLKAGSQVNVCKNHQTPLHAASKAGDFDMLCLLLGHGADVYLRDGRGRKAIQLVPVDKEDIIDLLKYNEDYPRSLRQICRLKIRKSMGSTRLNLLSHLRLPDIMTHYLDFS